MKSERALPCWPLFNCYVTSSRLIGDIGKFLTIYQNAFPKAEEKKGKEMVVCFVFIAVRMFFWE